VDHAVRAFGPLLDGPLRNPATQSDQYEVIVRNIATFGLVVFALVASVAADDVAPKFGPGAKIYVEKMDGGLDGFLRAELMKKKVPVTIVLDEAAADFVMAGASNERKSSWHEGWLSAQKDNSSGSVMIFSKATKDLIWAEEAGDRSLMWGSLARGGQRKVASRIADRLKDHLKKR
jgi:hypothetical protein